MKVFPKIIPNIRWTHGLLIIVLFVMVSSALKKTETYPEVSASPSTATEKIPDSTIQEASVEGVTVEQTSEPIDVNSTTYPVTTVVDGDTIKVEINGKIETVRIVGINTPETVDPRRPIECFGAQASQKLRELLIGKKVSLQTDITQSDRDRYGRLLRFIFLESEDVGLKMLREGFAVESLYSSTPHKYRVLYLQAQKEAQESKKGLWAENACPVSVPVSSSPKPAPVPGQPGNCVGPDLDCSDFKTHVEAQAFFDGCGFTSTNDPMNLDNVGVGDGVACESRP